jgi:HSP20 family protein
VAVADGNTLTIRGTAPSAESEGDYRFRELPHGGFERSVSLPCEIEVGKASGTIRDGMLVLILPKTDNRAQRQPIAID